MEVLNIVLFIVIAALVVFLSMKLGKYVDWLDKSTNISGAFIGGVMLAAVTSLPELFTSLSAIFLVGENGLVLGNILGSNLFNLATLSVIFIIFIKKFSAAKPTGYGIFTLCGSIVIYALVILSMFIEIPLLGHFNFISIIILGIYVLVIMKTPKTEEADGEDGIVPITVKQIAVRAVVCIVFLVSASIAITFISDSLATTFNLGTTFAGALLLGFTTSLPEVVSTFTLVKRGNINAAIGNVLGSCMFNFAILAICDAIGFGLPSIYLLYSASVAGAQGMILAVLGITAAALTVSLFTVKKLIKSDETVVFKIISVATFCAVVACYFAFIALSVGM